MPTRYPYELRDNASPSRDFASGGGCHGQHVCGARCLRKYFGNTLAVE
jgi:hypothetical protein